MDYLPEFHRQITVEDYSRAEKIIDQSAVMQFLEHSGYQFLNHSILNLRNQPGRFAKDLMPRRLRLITAKTLWNSMTKDLGWLSKLLPDDYKDGNQRLLELTRSAAAQTASKPRFIYTHLLLPHWPYLMDSAGNATNINFYTNNLSPAQKENAYIQYLAYTNRQMLQLMNAINRNSIIILMSDHAYRDRKVNGCAPLNNNFVSVYLPNRDYHLLHDSISNVNLFGSLFNTVFHTNIKQLRDSCIF